MRRCLYRAFLIGWAGLACPWASAAADEPRDRIEEIKVTGERKEKPTEAPRSYVSKLDAQTRHVATVEDFLAYEPSLIIRRRYIGDSNGTLGIRGANMFQTTRSLVFADGLPLHYLLQSQFSGSPRWSLVSPEEIAGMEVLYGPFSAEYSGNAMGGVVNIQTELPSARAFHLQGSGFLQKFGLLGTRENYGGRSLHAAYGDKLGNLSFYVSHDHLSNESQPMTFQFASLSPGLDADPNTVPTPVRGVRFGRDDQGQRAFYYGDTGIEDVTTNLTKLKLGYGVGDWLGRLTLAYEDRKRDSAGPSNYLRSASGDPFFGGIAAGPDGHKFSVVPSRFEISDQARNSLLLGGALDGPIGGGWGFELDFSRFGVLQDETRRSNRSPLDPLFDRNPLPGEDPNDPKNKGNNGQGRLTDFNNTGWVTLDGKLRTRQLAGRENLDLVVGYHFEKYELEVRDFDTDYRTSAIRGTRSRSGGQTRTQAGFAQLGWQIDPRWDLQLGARYERWSEDGFSFNSSNKSDGPQASRSDRGFSPKLSLGYAPNDLWKFRYSVARAVRFPIVEELFQNLSSTTEETRANADLSPELGLHHDLMIERRLGSGFLRAHLYHETVRDAIFNQTLTGVRNLSTYLPVDEETVRGVELSGEWRGLWGSAFDVRGNLSYTNARITKNELDPSIEGNHFPRMPVWRGNLLLTYHLSSRLDAGLGFRFASDSYGRLDNADDADFVFGAQDAYHFVNLQLTYRLNERTRVSFGIDNLFNEQAFVFHPWPSRTLHVEFATDL